MHDGVPEGTLGVTLGVLTNPPMPPQPMFPELSHSTTQQIHGSLQ